jgi:hypothetical protein
VLDGDGQAKGLVTLALIEELLSEEAGGAPHAVPEEEPSAAAVQSPEAAR